MDSIVYKMNTFAYVTSYPQASKYGRSYIHSSRNTWQTYFATKDTWLFCFINTEHIVRVFFRSHPFSKHCTTESPTPTPTYRVRVSLHYSFILRAAGAWVTTHCRKLTIFRRLILFLAVYFGLSKVKLFLVVFPPSDAETARATENRVIFGSFTPSGHRT
jgi:hypothetical protein